jgi:hypothetical protein
MLLDLARAVFAGVAAIVLPGYFWSVFLRPACGLGERLAYSCAVSLATVPPVALVVEHVAGPGITLWIAVAATGGVFGSGALALWLKGAAAGPGGPILPRPGPIRQPAALVLLAVAFVAALVAVLRDRPVPGWLIVAVLVVLVAAAVVARPRAAGGGAGREPDIAAPGEPVAAGRAAGPAGIHDRDPAGDHDTDPAGNRHLDLAGDGDPDPAGGAGSGQPRRGVPVLRASALAVVVGATAVRAYEPVVRYDWPSVRGLDHYSHAVMAEQMLAHGSYHSYLIYPPGFPAVSAVVCRLSGLAPLELFPVLAPALLVLTALAAYALGTRLWGPGYGLAAAAVSGLVLHGAYGGFADGRYPDLASAYVLVTMGVAALVGLYQSPTARSAALAVVLGAAPVLYHSVATLYAALLVALAALTALPCLLRRGRRAGALVVGGTLAGIVLLATCYAWYTYGFGWPVIHHSASSAAVSMVLGSQPVPAASHLLSALAPVTVWLGALGLAVLALAVRYLRSPAQVLAAVMILGWCAVMYLGSRTAADGFPQRFERDLGAGLSVAAAAGLGVIVHSCWAAWQRAKLNASAALALAVAVPAVLAATAQALTEAGEESRHARLPNPAVVAAGSWLERHNTGGNIVSTYLNRGITERSMLALGGYPGLMYYGMGLHEHARSLPPAGTKPLLDSQEVLEHPASCAAARAIASEDVRYVVLYLGDQHEYDLASFQADPGRYQQVFTNNSVIIYAPWPGPCTP